jgi:hypothetical protein
MGNYFNDLMQSLLDFILHREVFSIIFTMVFFFIIGAAYRIRINKTLIKLYNEFHSDYDIEIVSCPDYLQKLLGFKAFRFRIDGYDIYLFEERSSSSGKKSYSTCLESEVQLPLNFSIDNKCIFLESASWLFPNIRKYSFPDPELENYFTAVEREGDILSALLSDVKILFCLKKIVASDTFESIKISNSSRNISGKSQQRVLTVCHQGRIDRCSKEEIELFLEIIVCFLDRITALMGKRAAG